MSVLLTPHSQADNEDYDGENMHVSNGTWTDLTENVEGVTPWNGYHDPLTYSPEELRAIAATDKASDWKEVLEWLASEGGADLS